MPEYEYEDVIVCEKCELCKCGRCRIWGCKCGDVEGAQEKPALTLDEQVERILPHIERKDADAWLAGVRFAQGVAEYGDSWTRKTSAELSAEAQQERADEINWYAMAAAVNDWEAYGVKGDDA